MKIYYFTLTLFLMQCSPTPENPMDVQGHRGCRGLMPENTIPAFIKALELGVTTLEMDAVISRDRQVVISHEPYFRSPVSLDPSGTPVSKQTEKNHNLYTMDYDSIIQYDMGTLPDPNHPNRQNISISKPRLADVVHAVTAFCSANNRDLPFFNIEIKRVPAYDGIYHPPVKEFVDLVLDEIIELGIRKKTIVQSFDLESLQLTRSEHPEFPLALLIENKQPVQENIEKLGFVPEIYSCYYKFVSTDLIEYCHNNHIKVIPWTVNEEADIKAMIKLGVDGIISDYPDRVLKLL